MHGTIVLDSAAGRALRKQPAPVRAADVLYCAGRFAVGDSIYIAFRTSDGSQYVIATGVVRCDEATLRQAIDSRKALSSLDCLASLTVVRKDDISLRWPARQPAQAPNRRLFLG